MIVKKYVSFTEDDIKTLVAMWTDHSSKEIAAKLERTVNSVNALADKIRKAGYDLPKKAGKRNTESVIARALGLGI